MAVQLRIAFGGSTLCLLPPRFGRWSFKTMDDLLLWRFSSFAAVHQTQREGASHVQALEFGLLIDCVICAMYTWSLPLSHIKLRLQEFHLPNGCMYIYRVTYANIFLNKTAHSNFGLLLPRQGSHNYVDTIRITNGFRVVSRITLHCICIKELLCLLFRTPAHLSHLQVGTHFKTNELRCHLVLASCNFQPMFAYSYSL